MSNESSDPMVEKAVERLLDDNLEAVSPLPEYPGKVVFPRPTGKVYRLFKDAAKRRPSEDEGDFLSLLPHWRGAAAIATFEIEGMDSTNFDDVELPVIRWVVRVTDEYIRRFFLERN